MIYVVIFFFKQKTAYEMRISDWSSDVCSSDLDTLRKLIRKGTLNFSFVPVLCGSAFKNKGVQPLLDAVVDYLPSPLDVPAIKGVKLDGETPDERPSSDTAPFSALEFKIMNAPFVGTLTFARVYSGMLEKGGYQNSEIGRAHV